MIVRKGLFALLLLAFVPMTALQAMPVSEFLARANALEKKGAMALFSGDLKLLKGEIVGAAKTLSLERAAAQKAGRKPETCIPAKMSLSNSELLAHFRSIPAPRRGMSVKQGFAEFVRKKYPCPA